MKKVENPDEKIARYFWGSLLAFTVLIILDVITGFGVTSWIFRLFFPGKV